MLIFITWISTFNLKKFRWIDKMIITLKESSWKPNLPNKIPLKNIMCFGHACKSNEMTAIESDY